MLNLLYRPEQVRTPLVRDLDARTIGVDRTPTGPRRSLLAVRRAARRDGQDAVVYRIIEPPGEPVHP